MTVNTLLFCAKEVIMIPSSLTTVENRSSFVISSLNLSKSIIS